MDENQGKKPVPLPRRSLLKPQVAKGDLLEEEALYANESSSRESSLRKSFQEKFRSMNEIQKLEKSFRKMIPKRRSVAPKEEPKAFDDKQTRTHSLPDNDIFDNISFDSPFGSLTRAQRIKLNGGESDETGSDTDSFYTTSDLPPAYPPPPLPDESTYDELTSASSEGPNSYYSPSSDTASIYEELSNYLSISKTTDTKASEPLRSDSWSFYDPAASASNSRYEEIDDIIEPSAGDIPDAVALRKPEKALETSSLVLQFDPLFESKSDLNHQLRSNPFADPVILSFLNDDCDASGYGTVNKKHESILSDCENLNFELPTTTGPPPVPPRRFDSEEVTAEEPAKPPVEKRSSIIRWSSMKRVARLVAENIENSALGRKQEKKGLLDKSLSQENVVNEETEGARASLQSNESEDIYIPLVLHHSGVLYQSMMLKRWGVLAQRKLTIFANRDSPDVKETILMDSVLSLRLRDQSKPSVEGEQISCFEVSLAGKTQPLIFGAPSPAERHVWMRKILESVTPAFCPKLALDYSKAGWCYLKVGISSGWKKSSILLSRRSLHLVPNNGQIDTADLRKARFITMQDNEMKCKKTGEKGPVLLIDLQDRTLYLQMDTVAETTSWEAAIKCAALQNGPELSQQQLTKDDVPTIVDKTINFVHTHGSASEGIYRRSGSSSAVGKLLSAFRKDAWAVQLSRSEYTEFDVSSVLKRFLRDLPEPVFIPELHPEFKSIVEESLTSLDEKQLKYKNVLDKLPRLNYLTVRRLMKHLYFIDKLRGKNLMPVENLAAIWGPTLMHVQEGTSLDPNWSRVESTVISDLINHYPVLFNVSNDELERENKILNILETFHSNSNGTHAPKRPSGDLKVWVYFNTPNSGDCVSVEVPPGKVAREICEELAGKMSLPSHAVCLEEVVSGGQLKRPLHYSETVLEVVLRWGDWSEEDRRDNCLVLTQSTLLQELLPLIATPLLPAVDELKFADARSKNFKTHLFELSRTSLCYYKDKSCSIKVREWNLKDLIWYLGHENKRNPHTGWSITFITKDTQPTRTKDKPYFGNTLCGSTELQKRKWIAALLYAAHPSGILPPPVLIE